MVVGVRGGSESRLISLGEYFPVPRLSSQESSPVPVETAKDFDLTFFVGVKKPSLFRFVLSSGVGGFCMSCRCDEENDSSRSYEGIHLHTL